MLFAAVSARRAFVEGTRGTVTAHADRLGLSAAAATTGRHIAVADVARVDRRGSAEAEVEACITAVCAQGRGGCSGARRCNAIAGPARPGSRTLRSGGGPHAEDAYRSTAGPSCSWREVLVSGPVPRLAAMADYSTCSWIAGQAGPLQRKRAPSTSPRDVRRRPAKDPTEGLGKGAGAGSRRVAPT